MSALREPLPGQTWRKDGYDIQVHAVKDGRVYGAKFRTGEDEAFDLWKVPLVSFWVAVHDTTPVETQG